MQVIKEGAGFQPVVLRIVIESQEELDELLELSGLTLTIPDAIRKAYGVLPAAQAKGSKVALFAATFLRSIRDLL